jgi:hypothetical protein
VTARTLRRLARARGPLLPTPLRAGQTLPVVAAHSADRGAFWGTVANPPAGVSVGVRLDSFLVSAAAGTARVLGVDPLRIDLD